jgi:hypothetical protein
VKDAMVVALIEMIEIDPSLAELHDLPFGWIATPDAVHADWVRSQREAASD